MSDETNKIEEQETQEDASPDEELSYTPAYSIEHIRISLKAGERHPSEIFAADIFRNLPAWYLEYITAQLSESLQEHKDHSMGVVWETLRRVMNGEKVADRYLMGAALYLANTLFQVGPGCAAALNTHVEAQAHAGVEEEPAEEDQTETQEPQDSD